MTKLRYATTFHDVKLGGELLPCPFCGSEHTQVRWIGFKNGYNGAFKAGFRGECTECFALTRAFSTEAEAIAAWNTRAELENEINGDTSDGYHTFNELYHHRAVLFSVIVRDHRELAWKARKHYDGTMYEGMFIVGIETPKGQATYHYDLDPYWDMFDCEEREFAPEWDGHTPDEAIARIAELGSEEKTQGKITFVDTREMLEADVRKWFADDYYEDYYSEEDMNSVVSNWLDRQAAITEMEIRAEAGLQ